MDVAYAAARCWFDRAHLEPLGDGHIHATYHLRNGDQSYVLQRLNQHVYHDLDLVMAQTRRCLAHWRLQNDYRCANIVTSRAGKDLEYVADQPWRVFEFLSQTRTVTRVERAAQVRAAAAAFSAFQVKMRSLPGPRLGDSIEGFLQLPHYLAQFDAIAAQASKSQRRLVDTYREEFDRFAGRNAYIHGDCKIDNVLFSTHADEVEAVIDLDTVMYGHWAWDFGDLVRSVCFIGQSRDYDAYFGASVTGFKPHYDDAEAADFVLAPQYIAFMLGLRFLIDHWLGDVYFRVDERGQNLHRAQEQFALFARFRSCADSWIEVFERSPV